MLKSETIEHDGRVASVEGNCVSVDIATSEACGACSSRNKCALGQATRSRRVEIITADADMYVVGDRVTVAVHSRVGGMAVVLGYLVPLVVLVATLALCVGLGEGVAALVAIAAVAVYYAVLYLFRNRISRKVSFTISKSKI